MWARGGMNRVRVAGRHIRGREMTTPLSPQVSFKQGASPSLSVRVDEERRERAADGWEYSSYTLVTSYQ
eukprot:1852496-Prymnesium_polylepis.1